MVFISSCILCIMKLIDVQCHCVSIDNIVAELCACLESDSPNSQRIGASALWALLHNYQKVSAKLVQAKLNDFFTPCLLKQSECIELAQRIKLIPVTLKQGMRILPVLCYFLPLKSDPCWIYFQRAV